MSGLPNVVALRQRALDRDLFSIWDEGRPPHTFSHCAAVYRRSEIVNGVMVEHVETGQALYEHDMTGDQVALFRIAAAAVKELRLICLDRDRKAAEKAKAASAKSEAKPKPKAAKA